MALSHRLITQVGDKWHGGSELVDFVFQVLVDAPLADFLLERLNLLLEFYGSIVHVVNSQLVEADVLPRFPFTVPLFLHSPNLEHLSHLLLNEDELGVGHGFDVEDVKAEFHLLLLFSEFSGCSLELKKLLLSFSVVHVFVYIVWSVLLEVLFVLLYLLLEVINRVIHFGLQCLVALLNDLISLIEALSEFVPSFIKAIKLKLVLLSKTTTHNGDILLLLNDVLELLSNGISAIIKFFHLCLHFRELVLVLLKLGIIIARGLQLFNSINELLDERIQVMLCILYKSLELLLDELVCQIK
jgi:hypothetical protein